MSEATTISRAEKFLNTLPVHEDGLNLNGIRTAALDALKAIDFPTRKTEEWKYTKVGSILNKEYEFVKNSNALQLDPFIIDENAQLVVFVNGFFRHDLSTITATDGVVITSLKEGQTSQPELFKSYFNQSATFESDAFTALNTAYATDGVMIHVAKGTNLEQPIHLLHVITNSACTSQPRNLIVVEESAQANIIQSFETVNAANAFCNVVTEATVKANATLNIEVIQNEGEENYHINSWYVHQAADSNFGINTACISGAIIRNGLNVIVNGTNCTTDLGGLYLPNGKEHVDNHTMIDHKQPHCESNELYKGIMYDQSTGVFNGKVYVRPDAQKVNAFQQNNNILIGDDADVNSKPELEIYADDVKCSHGSTTGQFDEEAVFYLRARGLGEDTARKLLINAFAGEVLNRIDSDVVRERIEQLIANKFKTGQ